MLGKRRLQSESTNDSSFVKVTPQAIGTKNKKKKKGRFRKKVRQDWSIFGKKYMRRLREIIQVAW